MLTDLQDFDLFFKSNLAEVGYIILRIVVPFCQTNFLKPYWKHLSLLFCKYSELLFEANP